VTDLETVRQRYRAFAETECRGYSPLYERLARGAADDESIVRFIADRPVSQPNLFFAAVQFLLGADRMPSDEMELAGVLLARGSEVAELMDRRRTQTNEIGRCAVLLPALPRRPLAIVEVGASAGLCLLLDRFFYDYGVARIGDPLSPVRLECRTDGVAPPIAAPDIVWRRGLDIEPIDVHDADATRWLLACVWADHSHRRQRVAAALELARANPPIVVRGDLVEDLERVVREAPADACLVVLQSAVFPYVPRERRAAFAETLAKLSHSREVVWISNEAPGVVARLAPPPVLHEQLKFIVGRTTFNQGRVVDEILAIAHHHGSEMTWLEGATGLTPLAADGGWCDPGRRG
jgi:hypothetical protein